MKHISWKDCGEELVTESWGRESESIDSLIKNMNRDQQAVCVQIFAASILLEIKEDLELLTEPIKEERRKQVKLKEDERRLGEDARTKEFGPIKCACDKLLSQYTGKKGIAKVIRRMQELVDYSIWWDAGGRYLPAILYLLEKPVMEWTDKDVSQLSGVGKLTVQKFRSDIDKLVEVK